MKASHTLSALAVLLFAGAGHFPARATDTDGSGDCEKPIADYGDAPECIAAYPSGIIAQFPTCSNTCGQGTQEVCPGTTPISSAPGATGFVRHVQFGTSDQPNYWLGCHFDLNGIPQGIDSEVDGKTSTPPIGVTACAGGGPTDCVEVAYGGAMSFDQDECYLVGNDGGYPGATLLIREFVACESLAFDFLALSCSLQPRTVYLNVLMDFNEDGDWNDALLCDPDLCAPEWVAKNHAFLLVPGCLNYFTPQFRVGPSPGNSWMRITLTDDPVSDDFPWKGSVGHRADDAFAGGETEDYPIVITAATPALPSTWGEIKGYYR